MKISINLKNLALVGVGILIAFIVFQEWLHQKRKADFFQQAFSQSEYRDVCMTKAMEDSAPDFKAEWSTQERMAYAFTSDNYKNCLKAEPEHPALERYL
jgi:hypothetical protein